MRINASESSSMKQKVHELSVSRCQPYPTRRTKLFRVHFFLSDGCTPVCSAVCHPWAMRCLIIDAPLLFKDVYVVSVLHSG